MLVAAGEREEGGEGRGRRGVRGQGMEGKRKERGGGGERRGGRGEEE